MTPSKAADPGGAHRDRKGDSMTERALDRRSMLKLGGAGAVAALGAIALGGCARATEPSSEKLASTGTAAIAAPLSEDERIGAIADPIYMGAKHNFAGQELVIGTGREGQVANQAMIDKREEYDIKLHKVTDRVYCSVGNGLSNSAMIIGDTGMIIIDTNESMESAQFDLDAFRTVTDKPVSAVIYTHEHYVNGTELYVGKGNPGNLPIVAHEKLIQVTNSILSEMNDTYMSRGLMQFGAMLPSEGEDGTVMGGIGAYYKNPHTESSTAGFIAPNELIPDVDKAKMTEMTIDGVRFQFYPMFSDSAANINFFLPDERVAFSNTVWPSFFNMFTPRGAVYRDPTVLYQSIDTMIGWNAIAHVGCHGVPIMGEDKVRRELDLYRDCIQFVYDQTVRYMNKGYDPDQIAETVKIPAFMLEGMCTKPLYGEVEHFYRGVYRGTVGWFGTDPLELHPVSKKFESGKIVDAFGGADAVVAAANEALADDQFAWAATLATYVLNIDADNAGAKAAKAQAFRKMAQVTFATNTRHFYMTRALELEGKLAVPKTIPYNASKLPAAKRTLLLDIMRTSLDYEKAMDVNKSLQVTYTDEGVTNAIVIGNCVGQVVLGGVEDPTVEIKMEYPVACEIIAGKTKLADAVAAGTIQIVGDKAELEAILELIDRDL